MQALTPSLQRPLPSANTGCLQSNALETAHTIARSVCSVAGLSKLTKQQMETLVGASPNQTGKVNLAKAVEIKRG